MKIKQNVKQIMKRLLKLLSLLLFIWLLSACINQIEEEPAATAVDTAVPPTATLPPIPPSPTPTSLIIPSASPAFPTPSSSQSFPGWLVVAAPYDTLSRAPVTDAERAASLYLNNNSPPARDDIALAQIYWGAVPSSDPPPLVTEPLTVGARQNITVNNNDLNTNTSPEFELKYVSDHAYFWFDTTPGLEAPTKSQLETMGAGFDEIYENSHRIFGSEDNPGVDGDPRIHIVNTSPLNLCDITADELDYCWLAGYFSSHDLVPQSVDPTSNAREMFVMNGRSFGAINYLNTLAHEFRHMIEENSDINDWDWEVEGSAMLAEELLGYPGDGVARANLFLQNPDQQLNRWPEGNTLPHYGQGYLLNRYLYNRLGPDLYRAFAEHPSPAFAALGDIAAHVETDYESGLDLWLDWLVASTIHNQANTPEKYRLANGVNTAVPQPLSNATVITVSQYAADYYELPKTGTVSFTGSNHVPVLAVQPTSGSQMWLANRANYSSPRLIREFDLSAIDSATLEYDVYRDIETGYDFGYVTLSTDGGQTWRPLAGKQMQGAEFEDDPSDSALTERFYTGHAADWAPETIDLTPFAGHKVLLRFEYVTDPILTHAGLALDNISIPEIGFFDDAESDAGWEGNGFVRATGYLPQPWHLILITFENNVPQVQRLDVGEERSAVFSIPESSSPAILIVAASAPMTLETAHYQLNIE
ncbi:MAG: hypothetical protein GY796_09980 [Chloroflexi bacterium]|nr:hypothetical protein [Chloroflexota bacterium]